MAGKHIPALMLISSVVLVVSSFSAHHQSNLLVITSLPAARQTELEALSWDVNTQEYSSESKSSPSLSLRLHHVDNILSPLNSTPESLFKNRLSRDALRAKALSAGFMSSPVISGYPMGMGEYFTSIQVGTPPKNVYMILDTGSDLIWLQCAPCVKCYKQTYPIFKPNNSKSFSRVPCGSPLCDLLEHYGKCGRRKQCIYDVSYGDGSVSVGEFSTETLTFGKKTKVPKVAFGCGRYNKGLFVAASGLLGLGQGKLSFPSQIRNKFGNKFSYCLGNASQLIFGDSSSVYEKVVFTPLLTNPNPRFNTFYYVVLEGISVSGSRVQGINASLFDFDQKSGLGGVIVDSGSTVTWLARPAYTALRDAFRKGTWHLKAAPKLFSLDTCYDLHGMTRVEVPTVELHFHGGANMSLPASNYLVPVDDNGKFCFAFAAMDGGVSIIGNVQQQGFGMMFDLDNKRVGFAPNAC